DLMLTLPPFLTAATGMDALSHLVEAFVSTANNTPALDGLILRGIELIRRNLPDVIGDGSIRAARLALAEAAMLGGMAIASNYLGACHSLAHQLSTVAGMHHGHACGLLLPFQMEFSLPGALPRYAQIGVALGAPADGDVEAQADFAVQAVHRLMAGSGLPARLRAAGVGGALLPELASLAYKDLNWQTNPILVTESDLESIYRAAL
ncbi:MAG: iron-containing alcohol dehydrogenase family protein, partial [Anaerolineales bacterium]